MAFWQPANTHLTYLYTQMFSRATQTSAKKGSCNIHAEVMVHRHTGETNPQNAELVSQQEEIRNKRMND